MLTPQSGSARQQAPALLGSLRLLSSLCLFLSAVEYLIPKPLPFMRIGLANLPLLLALNLLGGKDFFILVLLKVLGQALIGGTLFSYVFLFSLAGTFSSAALMFFLHKLFGQKLGFAGLGCAGAMASNGVQLVLARYFIFGSALRYLIPPFLASGFITGIVLGLICAYFCRHSRWYEQYTQDYSTRSINHEQRTFGTTRTNTNEKEECGVKTIPQLTPKQERHHIFNANELFIAGFIMTLVFLFTPSLAGRIAQFLFFCLLVLLFGKKINPFITLMIMAGIVFFHLLNPYGKVLVNLGPLRITQGSLFTGLEKAITLEGLLMLSRACIASDLRLPGIGSLLGESFRLLELMRQKKGIIKKGRIVAGIDQLLLELESADTADHIPQSKPQRSIKNILLLCVMVLLTIAIGLVL